MQVKALRLVKAQARAVLSEIRKQSGAWVGSSSEWPQIYTQHKQLKKTLEFWDVATWAIFDMDPKTWIALLLETLNEMRNTLLSVTCCHVVIMQQGS